MDNENLNTDVRTHIEPEAVNHVEKNGYKQIKDLMYRSWLLHGLHQVVIRLHSRQQRLG